MVDANGTYKCLSPGFNTTCSTQTQLFLYILYQWITYGQTRLDWPDLWTGSQISSILEFQVPELTFEIFTFVHQPPRRFIWFVAPLCSGQFRRLAEQWIPIVNETKSMLSHAWRRCVFVSQRAIYDIRIQDLHVQKSRLPLCESCHAKTVCIKS